jgi:hypothetical protein
MQDYKGYRHSPEDENCEFAGGSKFAVYFGLVLALTCKIGFMVAPAGWLQFIFWGILYFFGFLVANWCYIVGFIVMVNEIEYPCTGGHHRYPRSISNYLVGFSLYIILVLVTLMMYGWPGITQMIDIMAFEITAIV